jgi:hypothetical protein
MWHSWVARLGHMRFYPRQVFQHVYSKQEAVVTEIKDHGRMALLRFTDATDEEWVSLADVSEAGEWRPKASLQKPEPAN